MLYLRVNFQARCNTFKDYFKIRNKYLFIFVFIFYLLYVSPLIVFNVPYIDDLVRTEYGMIAMSSVGRPLAELIFYFINGGGILSEITPLTQIIGISLFAYSVVFYCENKFTDISTELKFYLASSCIFSPFLLENLSYHIDITNQLFSAACAFLALAKQRKNKTDILFSILVLIMGLSLYQASFNLFLSLVLFDVILGINNNKNKFSIIYINIGISVISYFLYRLIINIFCKKQMLTNEYIRSSLQILPFNIDSIFLTWKHFKDYLLLEKEAISSYPTVFLLGIFILILIYIYKALYHLYMQKKIKDCVLLLLTLFLLPLMPFLAYCIFVHPIYYSRVMLGCIAVALFISYMGIYVINKLLLLRVFF